MTKLKLSAAILIFFALGVLLGAVSIHQPIPNAPPELPPPREPWSSKDVMGIIGSLGIRAFAGHLKKVPTVVLETDRTFALTVPTAKYRAHYVLVPKKDIRDAGNISVEDGPYLVDMFLTMRQLVEKEGLQDYRIFTNGPGLQTVGYLHFHLIGKRPHPIQD